MFRGVQTKATTEPVRDLVGYIAINWINRTTQMWGTSTQDDVGLVDFGVNQLVFTPCLRQI